MICRKLLYLYEILYLFILIYLNWVSADRQKPRGQLAPTKINRILSAFCRGELCSPDKIYFVGSLTKGTTLPPWFGQHYISFLITVSGSPQISDANSASSFLCKSFDATSLRVSITIPAAQNACFLGVHP